MRIVLFTQSRAHTHTHIRGLRGSSRVCSYAAQIQPRSLRITSPCSSKNECYCILNWQICWIFLVLFYVLAFTHIHTHTRLASWGMYLRLMWFTFSSPIIQSNRQPEARGSNPPWKLSLSRRGRNGVRSCKCVGRGLFNIKCFIIFMQITPYITTQTPHLACGI